MLLKYQSQTVASPYRQEWQVLPTPHSLFFPLFFQTTKEQYCREAWQRDTCPFPLQAFSIALPKNGLRWDCSNTRYLLTLFGRQQLADQHKWHSSLKNKTKQQKNKRGICSSSQRENQGKPILEPKEKAYYNVLCNRDVCNQKGQIITWKMQLVPTDHKQSQQLSQNKWGE